MPFEEVELKPLQADESARNYTTVKIRKWKLAVIIGLGAIASFIIGYLVKRTHYSLGDASIFSDDVTKLLFSQLNRGNIRSNLKELTEKVHIAGTDQEEIELVNLIQNQWVNLLDDIEIHTYNVLLSYPDEKNPNYVSMLDSGGSEYDKTAIKEPSLTDSENFKDVGNYFSAYGAAGYVTGNLVYVNYGRTNDFTFLKQSNYNVTGNICIAKYGKIFRGDKATHAEAAGCVGLIMFTDPKDYGNPVNYTEGYPTSWYMPGSGIQRGTLVLGGGDVLTIGYPAKSYMYKIPKEEAGLPNIPVHPISFEDAKKYLSKLGGDDAPADWQGGLDIRYKIGGKFLPKFVNHSISIFSGNVREQRNIRNIIGYIWGSEEPDRYVIMGNHRDAWVYGAMDPSSGTAVLMEMGRAFGEIINKDKWRPKRTLVFASWGAEEHGLIGSTEWVENYEHKLLRNAVAYFNVDIAVQGNASLRARATPNLKKVLYDIAKTIENPSETEIAKGRKTVFDTWAVMDRDNETNLPYVNSLGSGSDYTAFLQKVGVSSVDLRYNYDYKMGLSSYPIYHSAHETVEYFEKFLDPEYKFLLAVGQFWTELARRFSDEDILPFDCVEYGKSLSTLTNNVVTDNKEYLVAQHIQYKGLIKATENFNKACHDFDTSVDLHDKLAMRRLNDKLMYLDRGFIDFHGLPGRDFYRHVIFAPSSKDSYSSSGFPGIVDTIYDAKLDGNWDPVKKQFAVVQFYIESAADVFKKGLPA